MENRALRGILFDLDGVIYLGDEVIAGAADTLDWVRSRNIPHLFVTNTTSRPRGALSSKLAAMGKLYCSEVMGRVVNEAVQLHGGYGLMQDYDVERFFRDQKLLTIGEGTSEVQRIVIARHLVH